jgi:hypothetical protein
VKYKASQGVMDALGRERIERFLEDFAESEPWDTVKFIPEAVLRGQDNKDNLEEMFTCSNGEITLLVFPMITDDGEKYVGLTLEKECPHLDGLHQYGNIGEQVCWKCGGTGEVEEPVCGWCQENLHHSNCDDTYFIKVKCDACGQLPRPFRVGA